jgi:hypothetical protein
VELIGNFENAGQQWRRTKQPQRVRTHDFPTPDVPRAYPCGVYDIGRNTGLVSVGTDHHTGAFAVASIRGWNKIEHRLFSFISSNWRGEPIRDYETVVKLIAKTTTATGVPAVKSVLVDCRGFLRGPDCDVPSAVRAGDPRPRALWKGEPAAAIRSGA